MWRRFGFLWLGSTLERKISSSFIKSIGNNRNLQVHPFHLKTSPCWNKKTWITFMSSSNTYGSGSTVVQRVEQKLQEALHPKFLQVIPAFDDPNGSHVSIRVVSDKFENLSSLKRHQLVYKAIWEELQGPVHAVDSIEAKTPSEVANAETK
ncbi:hypothetical protein GAYE_SCF02G2132 [Galdieria yellowstonensis]|uniref:BolA-like protein n=1 Tax=Galdieria yellowstonensis TaxID=3028027 RepID=A0AAV9IA84_9RHOD|nr:hypothetical protein GAYE_SCF02G2132 [Galdieria yellowstonensis]